MRRIFILLPPITFGLIISPMESHNGGLPSKIGHYEIRGIAGRGAMAVVYDAFDTKEGRRVAIKVFRPETETSLSKDQMNELLLRFENEAEAVRRIDSEHVIDIYDSGNASGTRYIAMEFIEGTNLKELLELGTHFSLSEVADIAIQVAKGLDAIHALGIVHRDIKPANIVRMESGRVFITDFGIVKLSEDATLSQEGSIVGTPNYMSPEQIRGSHAGAIGPESDIFSLGVIVYELLTRRKPFEGKDVTQTLYNITHVHPPSPLIYTPGLTKGIEALLFRALAKNPDDRFKTASDFAIALSKLEQDEHVKNITLGGRRRPADELDLENHPDGDDGIPLYLRRASGNSGVVQPPGVALPRGLMPPVYCTDCGMENDAEEDYCVRCGLKVLRRAEFFAELKKTGRLVPNNTVKAIYIVINLITLGLFLLLLWLFLKSG